MTPRGRPEDDPWFEVEAAVLGSVMLDPGAYARMSALIDAGDFDHPRHGPIWRAMAHLVETGVAPEPAAIMGALRTLGLDASDAMLDCVCGLGEAVATAVNCEHYARKVRDYALQRRAVAALDHFARDLKGRPPEDVAEVIEGATAGLQRLTVGEAVAGALPLRQAADDWWKRLAAPDSGVTYPWPGGPVEVDARAGRLPAGAVLPIDAARRPSWEHLARKVGPLRPDVLAVFVGLTGRGKTAWAIQAAEAVAREGAPVLYASAELGPDELVARLVALRASGDDRGPGVAYAALMAGRAPLDELRDACAALVTDCPRFYVWAPSGPQRTGAELRRMTAHVSRLHEGAPPVVIVDYVQRFAPPGAAADRRLAVSDLSGELRTLSRPGGLRPDWPGAAVLALSSVSRNNYGALASAEELRKAVNGNGALEGFGKETGELEYDASILLNLAADPPPGDDADPRHGDPRWAVVHVAKNRYGRTGLTAWRWHPPSGRWETQDLGKLPELREPPKSKPVAARRPAWTDDD